MSNKKVKVAITGGIGGGKSTVAGIIKNQGYDVIDADLVAKELMRDDVVIRQLIIEEFGKESYINNSINTSYLRDTVFADKQRLEKLNAIVHPATIEKIGDMMAESLLEKELVFVESALIFEAKMDKLFDLIVLVLTDDEIKIERTSKRDNLGEEKVRQIIENQLSDNTKKGRSDFILLNNGSLAELEKNVIFFIELFKTLGKSGNIEKLKADEPEDEPNL